MKRLLYAVAFTLLLAACSDNDNDKGEEPTPPAIRTGRAEEVTTGSFVMTSTVTGEGLTRRGICYGVNNPPDLDDMFVEMAPLAEGDARTTITGLKSNTTYYVCAYAARAGGRVKYGTSKAVRTKPEDDDVVDIYDSKFESYLRSRYDLDRDGKLTYAEIKDVETIDISFMGVSSLSGIGYFEKLRSLKCPSNKFDWVDLSNNTLLEELDISGNKLESLDLEANVLLRKLNLSDNKFTELDLAANTLIEELSVAGNELTEIALTAQTALRTLDCGSNKLVSLEPSGFALLEELRCAGNALTSLVLGGNGALTYLDCTENELETLTLSDNPLLVKLYCGQNPITAINLSANTKLEELSAAGSGLTELNLAANTALRKLDCSACALSAIELSNNVSIEELDVSGNTLAALDLTANTTLRLLACESNEIASLDVSGLSSLVTLSCGKYKNFTTIDLDGCTSLFDLTCVDTDLSAIDLSTNTGLGQIDLRDNNLALLDVRAALTNIALNCTNNQRTLVIYATAQQQAAGTFVRDAGVPLQDGPQP